MHIVSYVITLPFIKHVDLVSKYHINLLTQPFVLLCDRFGSTKTFVNEALFCLLTIILCIYFCNVKIDLHQFDKEEKFHIASVSFSCKLIYFNTANMSFIPSGVAIIAHEASPYIPILSILNRFNSIQLNSIVLRSRALNLLHLATTLFIHSIYII